MDGVADALGVSAAVALGEPLTDAVVERVAVRDDVIVGSWVDTGVVVDVEVDDAVDCGVILCVTIGGTHSAWPSSPQYVVMLYAYTQVGPSTTDTRCTPPSALHVHVTVD